MHGGCACNANQPFLTHFKSLPLFPAFGQRLKEGQEVSNPGAVNTWEKGDWIMVRKETPGEDLCRLPVLVALVGITSCGTTTAAVGSPWSTSGSGPRVFKQEAGGQTGPHQIMLCEVEVFPE